MAIIAGALHTVGIGIGLELDNHFAIGHGFRIGIHPKGDVAIAIGEYIDIAQATGVSIGIGDTGQQTISAGLGICGNADQTALAAYQI